MEESVFISKVLNEFDGDDYLMVEKLLNLRSESLAKQFKDDVSRVLRSNNVKSDAVRCNNDSRSKTTEKILRCKQSKTNGWGSGNVNFCMLESKNHKVDSCKRDERVGKVIIKIRKVIYRRKLILAMLVQRIMRRLPRKVCPMRVLWRSRKEKSRILVNAMRVLGKGLSR
jgi:hypothetical protein